MQNRSPIVATLAVLFFVVATPIALVRRLTDGLLPTQAYDIVLGLAVLAWIFIGKAILERDNPLGSLIENRLSPSWQANSLVEQSMLGVGYISKKTVGAEPSLHRLQSASSDIELLMPPVVDEPQTGRVRFDDDESGRPRLQPTLRRDEKVAPPILATEEYVVRRGDTFWSIAEYRLGDGRRWKDIEEINIGRQVAPDVEFAEGNGLRIGWNMLVPLVESTPETAS